MTARHIDHDSFTVTRQLKAPPARVFRAFARQEEKRGWFVDTPGFTTRDYQLDCRPGGSEIWHGAAPGGVEITLDARYFDVLPDERLVFSYAMTLNGVNLSLSVMTMALAPRGGGTDLTLTEQVVHLDGLGTAADRKQGTEALIDALVAYLEEQETR